MPHKAEFPEVSDLVVCSVQNVKNFGAFVSLDEYGGKEGFIHKHKLYLSLSLQTKVFGINS